MTQTHLPGAPIAASDREDLGIAVAGLSPAGLVAHLDAQIEELMGEIMRSPVWTTVVDPATPMEQVQEILKEIYLEISMYQPDSIEAAIASIGQMPRDMPPHWVDSMLHHQIEEFDHGNMALRDYAGFGGDIKAAKARPQSPSAFAVAAIWRNITHKRDPFMYLGAVYLFDALTPIVTAAVGSALASRGLEQSGLEFITHHATADIEHAESIKQLIIDVAERYPESQRSIAYGFEYFRHVYPLPVWEAARVRASLVSPVGTSRRTSCDQQDLGTDVSALSSLSLVDYLDAQISQMLRDITASPFWSVASNPHTPIEQVQEILKEIYLEISMYQPDSIEAAIASIGQMPRDMPPHWVDSMLHHQIEEFDHGNMALRDYVGFGGDADTAKARPQSPSAFAVAAIWRNITHKRDPFMYLGAVYLFEALTPLITAKAGSILAGRALSGSGMEFITHHATADIEHASSLKELILEISDRYPDSRRSILYGFAHFQHVYPLAGWEAAHRRAMSRFIHLAQAAE